jgi:hypothetical protein
MFHAETHPRLHVICNLLMYVAAPYAYARGPVEPAPSDGFINTPCRFVTYFTHFDQLVCYRVISSTHVRFENNSSKIARLKWVKERLK